MDGETCERLYDTYYMRVFSYVMTLCGDRHAAEEITQDTFYRAFYKSGDYRNESDEATWLCAIAKNRFLDEKRKQRKMTEMPTLQKPKVPRTPMPRIQVPRIPQKQKARFTVSTRQSKS